MLPAPPLPVVRRAARPPVDAAASAEVEAARALTANLGSSLHRSAAFRDLSAHAQQGILADLDRIHRGLGDAAATAGALGTPLELRRAAPASAPADAGTPGDPAQDAPAQGDGAAKTPGPKAAATDTIARRAGALSDEIDFPKFVAALVHGTFDAIVEASIRQMEAFAELVSAVAKSAEDFTRENITPNQARDWLVAHYPQDLELDHASGEPKVVPRASAPSQDGSDADEPNSPAWLGEFDLAGEALTPELIETQLVPKAQQRAGQNRLQTLATMVLLGMNRVVVRDGTISARLRFRAVAADTAKVDYAVSNDPSQGSDLGTRGSTSYATPSLQVSTVGVNVQADSELRAELFGEVKINFASETLPLERFVDDARRTLLERHARPAPVHKASPPPALPSPAGGAPAAAPASAVAATPAPAGTVR
ncbi:hypothetical protein [Burkholderia ubonensis]|nr:hypothetical protein [Burkholderia ubonensis]